MLFPPPYLQALANRACAGNEVKLGRKEYAPLQRGIGHKSTVAHGLECKTLSFMDPSQKIQADENRAHLLH